MKATVERPVRTRGVKNEELTTWANRELLPLLIQVRDGLNIRYLAPFEITTPGDGQWTTIYTSDDIPVGQDWLISAEIRATASTARSAWFIRGMFYNDGTVAQEGTTAVEYSQTSASFDVRFAVTDNHLTVDVQDDGALDVSWLCIVSLRENVR
jgi:hypothetical protein